MTIARIENDQVIERRNLSMSDVPEHKRSLWRPVLFTGEGPIETVFVGADTVVITRSNPPLDTTAVDAERDRRMCYFSFEGKQYDSDPKSAARIDKARGSALAALISRPGDATITGDLRWADPNVDFGWFAADNSFTAMDAVTTLSFGNRAASWEGLHIVAARNLKNMVPIPEDYADDTYWPSA